MSQSGCHSLAFEWLVLTRHFSRLPLKLRTPRDNDYGSTIILEPMMKPKDRQAMIQAKADEDLARRKQEDHGWEDLVDVSFQCFRSEVQWLTYDRRTHTNRLLSRTHRVCSKPYRPLVHHLRQLFRTTRTRCPRTVQAVYASVAVAGRCSTDASSVDVPLCPLFHWQTTMRRTQIQS